uniref:Uncharacterized protein n=1 Tax=Catagonus wagneri TaxID=51154 RepID=A0A8C3XAR9_9CETA
NWLLLPMGFSGLPQVSLPTCALVGPPELGDTSLPGSPLSPFAPLSPGAPLSPFGPGGPLAPDGPGIPVRPTAPGKPVAAEEMGENLAAGPKEPAACRIRPLAFLQGFIGCRHSFSTLSPVVT